MIDQTLTTPPTAPSSNDIPTFRTRFDAFIVWIVTFVSQLTTVISQINSTASTINDKEASTIASAQVAVSAANFKGTYTTQTTQVGESYLWNGIIYLVLVAGNTSPTASPSNWRAMGISDQIHSSSSKTTPIDNDEFGIWDSVGLTLKKLTFSNLKATIISSFGVMLNTLTSKTTPVDTDVFVIGDSASSFASKKLSFTNLKSFLDATWVSNDNRSKTALNAAGSAPIYACRAWVNFNGTGTISINNGGNISSLSDYGVGDYGINFYTPMPDASYAFTFGVNKISDGGYPVIVNEKVSTPKTANGIRVIVLGGDSLFSFCDISDISISFHR